MELETIGLEEVVAVGYGVQKRATLTGSVGSVKADDLVQRPVANTTELLQGQIAGLQTRQTSGLPGSDGTTLNIRGFGGPLVLIDGVEGALAQVDPNDISSVSVLKDASAAVYGARAGNGVILVTTKRGEDRPAQITYHGTVSLTQPTFLPKQVNATKWAEMLNESGLNSDDYSPAHIRWNDETKSLYNSVTGEPFSGYNWADALYRNWTPQTQHNISARGGSQKVKYFISAGFTDQESNFKAGDYDFNRYNIRSNVDADITDNISASVDFAYRIGILDRANHSELYNELQTAKPVYPYIHENDPERAAYSGFLQRSPYAQTFKEFSGSVENKENQLQGAFELRYKFPMVKGLVAKARLSYEEIFSWDKTVSKPFDVWEYNQVNESQGLDPWVLRGTKNTNRISVFSSRASELLPLFSLEYDNLFGDHHVSGMLISETRTYKFTSLTGSRRDVLSFEAPYLRYASEEGKDNHEGTGQAARSSIIGRVNYDYLGKYLFEFALRADASAEYPPETRWGYFPSVSAGWRISEEAFLKDNPALNSLKLRGSYGVLGNDAVSSFDYLTGYNITTNYYIFGTSPAPVIESAGLANPNITWETMKISNIGLDGTLWNGKLGFEIDAFYRLRENILAAPTEQIPSTFGASLPRTNLNKRDNRGFEITLTHMNRIGDFSYDISPMFSWTRGKYVDLDEDVLPETGDLDPETLEFNKLWNARYVNEGQWDDRQWGYIVEDFFMNQQQIDDHEIDQDQAGNQTLRVGDFIYKDLNGDNYIDWRDQAIIGKNGLPNTMYSLDMGAQWKGFSLRLLWQGGAGYNVSIGGSARAPFSNESIPLDYHYEYRAIVEQDANGMDFISNPDGFKLPPVTQNGVTSHNGKGNDFWNINAAFLRLKNVHLSYSLPKSWISTIGINNCILYFSGSNMWAISNLGIFSKSFDPEIPGANNQDYPPVKTGTFGIRLTL
jgi:TonB-linked SusC/RagA family outer membrane protein